MLRIENLHLAFDGINALSDISFSVNQNELVALIGPNGAGKTCVLNCISGFYRPQKGHIYFENYDLTMLSTNKIAGIGISRTFQHIELYTGLSTLDNLMAARHIHMKYNPLWGVIYFGKARNEEIQHRKIVEQIIDLLDLQSIRDSVVGTLPYGLRKRVDLGRALALEPKVLLLDEPLAGMNLEEKEQMARFILDILDLEKPLMIMVEHDMQVVMDIADRIIVLDFGNKIAEGKPEEIKANDEVIKIYLR
jgi:branched-chain amino acid transport system ATP-binding protein